MDGGTRWKKATFLALLVSVGAVAASPIVLSYSDGEAGGTGQIPEHLRECAEGFEYCKVQPRYCSGCHGQQRDMQASVDGELAVTDRIAGKILINGDPQLWEYDPDRLYLVDVSIVFKNGYNDPDRRDDARPAGYGDYSSGGFDMNASAGRLGTLPGDDSVRITAGNFTHYGTRNESGHYQCPHDPTQTCRYGNSISNESRHGGEATHTWEGSKQRSWQVSWRAPSAGSTPGVAFQATVMVPNGNGFDDCVHKRNESGVCDSRLGYSDPENWDWWNPSLQPGGVQTIPRAVMMCERGLYDNAQECFQATLEHVLPPTPPPDTSSPDGDEDGLFGGNSPAGPAWMVLAAAAAAGLLVARRRTR